MTDITRDKTEPFLEVPASKNITEVKEPKDDTFLTSLLFSTERFNFVSLEESGVVNSIDQASQLFTGLQRNHPHLKKP